jgi:hypothetical protein
VPLLPNVPLLLLAWQPTQSAPSSVAFPATISPPPELEELELDELLELVELLELEVELELLDADEVELLDVDEDDPLELEEELLEPIPPLVQPWRARAPAAIKIKAIFLISTTLSN